MVQNQVFEHHFTMEYNIQHMLIWLFLTNHTKIKDMFTKTGLNNKKNQQVYVYMFF